MDAPASLTPEPLPPTPRPREAVPRAVRDTASWSWRLLVIAAAALVLIALVTYLSQAFIPVTVAVLLAAALTPVRERLQRIMPRAAAAGLTVIGTIAVIAGLLALVTTQIARGSGQLGDSLNTGISQIQGWLQSSFGIDQNDLQGYWTQIKEVGTNGVKGSGLTASATQAGLTAGHFVAGTFIALFTLFFMLFQGEKMWAWLVGLFPRVARERVDTSGQVAFTSLSSYVRAQVIVACVDAVGITIGALILGVPFPFAIGVLTLLLSFIPIVGAIVAGAVAVVLALVAHGPVIALVMLGVVLLVQQLEAHVLQPFILGRSVEVHPVAVILAIVVGGIVGGIVGTLIAVPAIACLNAAGKHLARVADGMSPQESLRVALHAEGSDEAGKDDKHGAGDTKDAEPA